jgi:hypothetical protein
LEPILAVRGDCGWTDAKSGRTPLKLLKRRCNQGEYGMACKQLVVALSVIAAASPVSAASQGSVPMTGAPAGTPDTRYCMRIEAFTGSRIEEVKCWTRQEWVEQGVDVDEDWPREGVRVLGG